MCLTCTASSFAPNTVSVAPIRFLRVTMVKSLAVRPMARRRN